MTAEVAILNKLGVALAADSAVTISEGTDSRKVFNTADKLFQLSRKQSIACMVFSNLQFMQAPLQVLIKEFRNECDDCETVADASKALLKYLQEFASKASVQVKTAAVQSNVRSIYEVLSGRVAQRIEGQFADPDFLSGEDDPRALVDTMVKEAWESSIELLEEFANSWPEVEVVGEFPERSVLEPIFRAVFENSDRSPPENQVERVIEFLTKVLKKGSPFEPSTGLVVAGYGSQELFPTLEHFDLYTPVIGAIKVRTVERVDIGTAGPRARVMAFAQREMAERFLFGLDSQIKAKILRFCRGGVPMIGDFASSLVEFEDDTKAEAFRTEVRKAEEGFIAGLEKAGLETIREESHSAVEDMVEFMPKQDLAEFAEALVNLSSLQRRVNSGFETVGGPIDVAVISKSEGLVWVKRKHYFDPTLNARFFNRIGAGA